MKSVPGVVGPNIRQHQEVWLKCPAIFIEKELVLNNGVATDAERREYHVRRRASLLGCDAVTEIRATAESTHGVCIKRRAGAPEKQDIVIMKAPYWLVAKAEAAGPAGLPLLKALHQSAAHEGSQAAWPLNWYLRTYPESPFVADVQSLFVPADVAIASAPGLSTVRAEPTDK